MERGVICRNQRKAEGLIRAVSYAASVPSHGAIMISRVRCEPGDICARGDRASAIASRARISQLNAVKNDVLLVARVEVSEPEIRRCGVAGFEVARGIQVAAAGAKLRTERVCPGEAVVSQYQIDNLARDRGTEIDRLRATIYGDGIIPIGRANSDRY